MEKHLKPEIMNSSGSPPPELDSSKIENDKATPTIISMSPEYPKYRDAVIIGTVFLIVAVFIGGIYFFTRHSEWSVKKSVENIIEWGTWYEPDLDDWTDSSTGDSFISIKESIGNHRNVLELNDQDTSSEAQSEYEFKTQ